eukprot:scaffold16763_cov117-Isochrysis_galbana.AAC.3
MDELLFMRSDIWSGYPTFRGGRGGSLSPKYIESYGECFYCASVVRIRTLVSHRQRHACAHVIAAKYITVTGGTRHTAQIQPNRHVPCARACAVAAQVLRSHGGWHSALCSQSIQRSDPAMPPISSPPHCALLRVSGVFSQTRGTGSSRPPGRPGKLAGTCGCQRCVHTRPPRASTPGPRIEPPRQAEPRRKVQYQPAPVGPAVRAHDRDGIRLRGLSRRSRVKIGGRPAPRGGGSGEGRK